MIRKTLEVKNKAGVHARPAAALVKAASKYKSDVFIHMYGYKVNGKSILGVMTLAAECGSELEFEINGQDEEKAFEEIKELFDTGFGEEM